jgi:hypothetical protein
MIALSYSRTRPADKGVEGAIIFAAGLRKKHA